MDLKRVLKIACRELVALFVVLLAIYVPGHLASLDLGLIASVYLGLLVTGGAAIAVGALACGVDFLRRRGSDSKTPVRLT